MIPLQAVVDRMISVLDAEGSDRYLFDQDFKPAINSSMDWLVAVFNSAFADKKLPEENLRDLVKTTIWQASSHSRVYFDEADSVLGYKIWAILGVFPEPTLTPIIIPPVQITPEKSSLRKDISFLSSEYSAERLTIEEWNLNAKNIFAAGNKVPSKSFKRYAYLGHGNYESTNYIVGGQEIEIRPSVADQFVAVSVLKVPRPVSLITDSVEFPESVFDILYQKALNFIAFKQGDKTSLYNVTTQDVSTLAKLMI